MILAILGYLRGWAWKSSLSGRFVTRAYAEQNPHTTYRQTFWRKP